MDNILKLTLLYDFYGELLTDKQKYIYEMFYQNDLSLTEIAEELKITRQGVRDQLKHAEKKLLDLEDKLHLLERFQEQKKSISDVKEKLEYIMDLGEFDSEKSINETLNDVMKIISNLLD